MKGGDGLVDDEALVGQVSRLGLHNLGAPLTLNALQLVPVLVAVVPLMDSYDPATLESIELDLAFQIKRVRRVTCMQTLVQGLCAVASKVKKPAGAC